MNKVSIIIPSNSNSSGLRRCLESLVKHTDLSDVETIVVANGATEETRTICHEFPVRLVWEAEAQGYTKATNLGISHATGEFILLLNDDCEILDSPQNYWIETLIAPLTGRTAMSGVHEIWSEEIRHNFIPFYCAMIRRDVFDHIGLPDEDFSPGFGEDIDWCARMLRAGYNYVNVDPHAKQSKSLMVGSFPLYHAGTKTFHETPERRAAYEQIVQRNLSTLRERYSRLRLLVVLVNYGAENLHYLRQVINRYRSFTKYEVSIVVHSNVPIEGVETVLHVSPPNGSWLNLPWECRKTIYNLRDIYDLYLYSENDHLITERNINAFVNIDLPDNMIAGFMRYENSPKGRFYPDYHGDFDWDLSSVRQIGKCAVAKFGNLHQGSFLVTRKQLASVCEMPEFLDSNKRWWNSEYDTLARCSTDLYDTGFEKVIPISHFEDFLIHHLPDKYYGVYDTKGDDVMQPLIGQMLGKPKYSIIIPTLNHLQDCFIPCCESLKKYTDLSNVEVLIVANGCTDNTRAYVESLGRPFKLLWFDEAQGFTRATNAGIRAARGEYIVFMNNDVYLIDQTLNGWLDKLQELWDSVPNAGVVGALVENVFIGKKFVAFYLAMTSRKVVDQIGMLDESAFSSGGEDVDFCIRAQNAGYEIIGNQTVYDEQGNKRFAVDFPFHHLGETTVSENPNFMDDWKKSNAILTSRYGTKYSIVIPTYNHCDDLLKPCVESIIEHTDLSRVEVLIVANGCTDSTREYVESLGAPFKLIWYDEKLGFIKATNIGIEAAEGEYVIFLNNDVVLKGEWIPILEKPFSDPKVGMTGPLVFKGEEGKSNDFVMFFCACTKRSVIDEIGLLDERFCPAGVEDIDFGLRLQLAGYKLVQVPEGEEIDRRTDVSSGSFPIVHMGNASYGKEEGWHDILRRNNELLKEKYPDHFKGLDWLAVDYTALKKRMKEVDQQVYYELFEVDVYKVPESEIRGKTIIDVGGNKGFFSILCMEMGAKECHSFEPVPSIYAEMQDFIKDIPEIHPHNLAVLDGSVSEVHMKEDSWCSTIWGDQSGASIPCVSLVDAIGYAKDQDNLVLKLDCEGSEYEILFNTPAEVLKKFSSIYLETHDLPNPNYLGQGKRLVEYVESLGFKVIHGPQPGTWFDDLFVPSPIKMYKLLRQPKVNIIISTYKRHALLREALDSVQAQTYKNINVLVVADGKDEAVEKIVSEYPNASYYDIPHDGNIGSKAKIHGIEQVTEGYVCFLDDDNVLLPDYAEAMVGALDGKDAVIGQVLMHGTEDGEELIRTLPPDGSFPTWKNIDTLNFLVEHRIAKLCKDKWIQEGEWVNQDFRFISECLKHTDYSFVPRILAHHREVKAKVWDIFPYLAEDDILEIRLNELYSVVDKFLIVEANRTHSGNPKPYYLSENLERFEKWKNKIVIHKVDLSTIDFSQYDFDPIWVREHLQRDAARQILPVCDFIIVGDVDEIPRASVVREYIQSKPDKVGVLVQDRLMYHLNYKCVKTDEPQLNSKILPYSMLGNHSLNDIRFADKENLLPTVRLENAGWHMTFMGGEEKIKDKLGAFAHAEYQRKIDQVPELLATGQDIYDAQTKWELVPIDDTFPRYVVEHQSELKAKGFIKETDTVTASVSTKDRYFTTLPMCLSAIASQTRKPDKLIIYDDGEQKDLRDTSPFDNIFLLFDEMGIKWEVVATPRQGQVTNHQHCLSTADTTWIWRVDDDETPEPDCLAKLLETVYQYESPSIVGAVSGLVHHPGNVRPLPDSVNGTLSDVSLGLNIAWFCWNGGPREVSHLYSTFLYRVKAGREAGGYPINLSPVGHHEESIFTHQIHRAGYKVLITPHAKTWHLRDPVGGIRSFNDGSLWAHDEQVFQEYLRTWGVATPEKRVIALDSGIGDHYAFKSVLPKIREKYADKQLVLAVCYPAVFEDTDIELISIADAKLILGERIDDHNVYKWAWDRNWKQSLAEAYLAMQPILVTS